MIPICVKCNQEMRCLKNRRVVHDPKVGEWPETYWIGDEYGCPVCDNKIVTGFAQRKFTREEVEQVVAPEDMEGAVPFVHSVEHRPFLEQYGITNDS
jgi:hypothetical protein